MHAGKKSHLQAWLFWYPLNQDSILTAEESCGEPKEYSEHYGALWEKEDETYVDILEKFLRLGKSGKLQGKVNIW